MLGFKPKMIGTKIGMLREKIERIKQIEHGRSAWQIDTDAQGRKIRINRDTGVSELIKDSEGTPVMGKVSDKVMTSANALDQTILDAEQLSGLLDKHKDTLWIGGGGQGAVGQWWNRNVSGDPERSDMYRLAQKIANSSLYELSGAQINNKEYDRLRKTLTDPNASEGAIFLI
jgi:hypothetical protein